MNALDFREMPANLLQNYCPEHQGHRVVKNDAFRKRPNLASSWLTFCRQEILAKWMGSSSGT